MKTGFAIITLAMMSGVAVADWEDVFRNPDLDPKYGLGYDLEFPPVQPSASKLTSLDGYYRNNPDVYSGLSDEESTAGAVGRESIATTSLDVFTDRNPDQYDGIAVEAHMDSGMPHQTPQGIGDAPRSF